MLYRVVGVIFVVLLGLTLWAQPGGFRHRRPGWQNGVHGLAVFTVGATLLMLCLGGLVTSHNVGMAVPDWPNSFGYNMFLLPVQDWVGGVFYEHSHRLWGTGIGLLTTLLALGLAWTDERQWVRSLGLIALALVVVQGLLGGFRVTENSPFLAWVHGVMAQVFFVLVAFVALATSPWWQKEANGWQPVSVDRRWIGPLALAVALVFVQLLLGAAMRHAQLGLAIRDFPLAYGQVFPTLDADSIHRYNQARLLAGEKADTDATQILLQLAHRFNAVMVFLAIAWCADRIVRRRPFAPSAIRRGAWMWLGLVSLQFVLGAWTVWSNKAADIASMHVAVGALTLVTGILLLAMCQRVLSNPLVTQRQSQTAPVGS
jgi:cytochrome c oxidase assembly protein subunit 15